MSQELENSEINVCGNVENFPQQMRYLRRKIIEELLDTERDYVNLLRNLVQVFI